MSTLNLRLASQQLRDAGHPTVRPDIVEKLMRGIARDGRKDAEGVASFQVRKIDRQQLSLRLQALPTAVPSAGSKLDTVPIEYSTRLARTAMFEAALNHRGSLRIGIASPFLLRSTSQFSRTVFCGGLARRMIWARRHDCFCPEAGKCQVPVSKSTPSGPESAELPPSDIWNWSAGDR